MTIVMLMFTVRPHLVSVSENGGKWLIPSCERRVVCCLLSLSQNEEGGLHCYRSSHGAITAQLLPRRPQAPPGEQGKNNAQRNPPRIRWRSPTSPTSLWWWALGRRASCIDRWGCRRYPRSTR